MNDKQARQVRLSDQTVIEVRLGSAEVLESHTVPAGTVIRLEDVPAWRKWPGARRAVESAYRWLRDVV